MTRPGETMMRLLRTLGPERCLTLDALAGRMAASRKNVSEAATRLISRGYVERVERGCFRLTAEGRRALAEGRTVTSGPNGPHTGPRKPNRRSLRGRLWNAMRVLGKFTVADLVRLAGAGAEKGAYSNAWGYVRGLEKAGYFRRLPGVKGEHLTSNRLKRFMLVRNDGLEPPTVRPRKGEVWDPNTGEVHPWSG